MTRDLPEPRTSFERGLSIMVQIASSGEASVNDLSKDLGIPVSTVYRYVKSLRKMALIDELHGRRGLRRAREAVAVREPKAARDRTRVGCDAAAAKCSVLIMPD